MSPTNHSVPSGTQYGFMTINIAYLTARSKALNPFFYQHFVPISGQAQFEMRPFPLNLIFVSDICYFLKEQEIVVLLF